MGGHVVEGRTGFHSPVNGRSQPTQAQQHRGHPSPPINLDKNALDLKAGQSAHGAGAAGAGGGGGAEHPPSTAWYSQYVSASMSEKQIMQLSPSGGDA